MEVMASQKYLESPKRSCCIYIIIIISTIQFSKHTLYKNTEVSDVDSSKTKGK